MKSLPKLRTDLEELNREFFSLLERRKKLVSEIQSLKSKASEYPHYDERREKELFSKLKTELLKLSKRELLAFSLIVEEHAKGGDEKAYPSFFKGDLGEGMNPNLKKVISKS